MHARPASTRPGPPRVGRAAVAALLCAAGLAAPAEARVVREDFMNEGAAAAAYDPFFNYNFGGTHDYPSGDSHALFMGSLLLSPDRVMITFNPDESERVTQARLLLHDYASPGQTRVTFYGTNGTYALQNFLTGTGETFILPSNHSIGLVTGIEIRGRQTLVRWIEMETFNPAPSPGTLGVAAVGAAALARRRR